MNADIGGLCLVSNAIGANATMAIPSVGTAGMVNNYISIVIMPEWMIY